MGESSNSIRKELDLHDAGYLDKVKNDNKIEYQANTKHPLYDILKSGPETFRFGGYSGTVLERMGNVQKIILVGDYAEGNDSGNIEIFLIGKGLNMEYISIRGENRKTNKRKVSFYLASNFERTQKYFAL